MRQEVTCLRCKHVSTTFQHMMDILVDIRQASNIEQALQNYFRQEKLGQVGDEASLYKCEKCKIKVSAKRRYIVISIFRWTLFFNMMVLSDALWKDLLLSFAYS